MRLGPIRQQCPPEFQQRVTDAGGVNKYDEPNFKIAWMGSETIRAGGVWENPDIPGVQHYAGYRDVLADVEGEGWAIRQWMPPESVDDLGTPIFGTPGKYYADNFDPSCGLQILAGYPYSGRYFTVFPLVYKEGNRTEIMPLSALLIDVIIPIVVMAKEITLEHKKMVIAERKAREDEARVSQIEAAIRDASPAFGEIRSAAGLSCLSVVQKKVEEIERHWAAGIDFVRQRGRGLSIAN